ncbi:hypothetical protein VPH1254_0055 [Vibrio phage 1254]|nr:hypothetical protein SIPHO018v1_10003 [Vibrio phage 11E33.1]QZI92546.1 hypothetical protein SIPHO017v1_p0013 [Vibrio phage 19E33.1]QZI92781.1 hypothetical protein SIPHO016v1_p0002 [Vibrio phage 38E33.6a]QZI92969.1 hypothetical protein SIPHO015v1_p0031 [Vibrio phage 82E32.2]QZI93012.1 hypothetical protein SIPHO014v1_p0013 [Vibrio phage 82E32.3]QZI93123.1 hypothetical protein SIPHO013v1_p0062 [Vibrio phage 82E33.2]
MIELDDIKAGDKVLVTFNTGGYSPKTFLLPAKVKRTNKTQIVLVNEFDKEVKYRRDTGYEVGKRSCCWQTTRRIEPYTVEADDTKRFEDYKARKNMELKCRNLIDNISIKSLGDKQLGSLVDLLKELNK